MTAWRIVPTSAVTRDRRSDPVTYVVVGSELRSTSSVHGYAIHSLEIDRWVYHRFQPIPKDQTIPLIAEPVGSGLTMAAAIDAGIAAPAKAKP